jgi:hypothetical protein
MGEKKVYNQCYWTKTSGTCRTINAKPISCQNSKLWTKTTDSYTRGVLVQQATTIARPINILVTTRLFVYGNGVPIQQPRRANLYP